MVKKLYAAFFSVALFATAAFSQGGVLKGTLKDNDNGETLPFANVALENTGGGQVASAITDINGEFTIKPIPPGKYNVKAASAGYGKSEIANVVISENKTTYLEIKLKTTVVQKEEVVITEYSKPLVDPDTKSGSTVTREEYMAMPSKNINSVASTTAGIFQKDEGKELNIRGSRSSGTAYYVDGEKVIGSANLPQQGTEQIQSIIGGTPAQYGDATGGIISVTSSSPQSKFFGSVEGISSQLTDAYGYNHLGWRVGGPVISKKDSSGVKTSKLGFVLSGEAFTEKDDDPSAVGTWKVKDDKLADLENNPLRVSDLGTGMVRTSEYLTYNDLEHIKYKQNIRNNTLRLQGKLDFKASQNLDFVVGGNMDYYNRHDFIWEYALLNPSNNPNKIGNTWRVYGRLTQKFSDKVADEKTTSNITNAYYTIQVGYSKSTEKIQDDTHKDNLFDYGYIGKFVQSRQRTYEFNTGAYGNAYYQNGWAYTGVDFYTAQADPNNINDPYLHYDASVANPNPLEANYTLLYYNLLAGSPSYIFDIQNGQGIINGYRPGNVYSLWYNTGRQYNGYSTTDNGQFRVSASFSADIKKKHAIMAGFEYEQRNDRYYVINPINLWQLLYQDANFHISQLNKDSATATVVQGGTYDTIQYPYLIDYTQQKKVDKEIRKQLQIGDGEWIDINAYDPSTFSVSMFSADDLLNNGNPIINYYGYDHTGKKISGNPSFEDFFTKKDADGYYTRLVPAFQPIYIAGYIQDKFDFKDIKFNVGVRVDRFDANQKVLKDKYLMFESKTVAEVTDLGGNPITHPSNVPSSATVYVNDLYNPTFIKGYRNGDVWYDSKGNVVTDPTLIAQGTTTGQITPYLVDPNDKVGDKTFLGAFKDYSPQVTVMPRVAFSFPISDIANFFAHYDVLSQRPSYGSRLDPIQYLQILTNQGAVLNNPDLKPERTTDYELGFTQVLSEKKNSALTISAFYRELRNMIQIIKVNRAYPATYLTYGNIDFGTVKGFSVGYDLRRENGIALTANYTLQFADGTGSSATDGYNLANTDQPNLRSTIPLDFDQRHTIVTNLDYRFGKGKEYRGPVWKKGDKEIQLLANVGANLVFRAGSGLPYSKQNQITEDAAFGIVQRATLKGSVNGSNLPWQYRIDLRVDKGVDLKWGKKEGEKAKTAYLNVYVQVLNLLNTPNVMGVYRFTGNPNDDGYLTSPAAQANIAASTYEQSFRDLYSIKVNNPGHYSIPRRIRVGVTLDF